MLINLCKCVHFDLITFHFNTGFSEWSREWERYRAKINWLVLKILSFATCYCRLFLCVCVSGAENDRNMNCGSCVLHFFNLNSEMFMSVIQSEDAFSRISTIARVRLLLIYRGHNSAILRFHCRKTACVWGDILKYFISTNLFVINANELPFGISRNFISRK
jgi:hypothetical protein